MSNGNNGNLGGNLSGFDANKVKPDEGFDVLPAGEYDVVITKSERKATSAGTGAYLNLEMQVLNGQFQNRRIFDLLNLWNPSEKATAIARGTLSAICRAVGVLTPNDSSDLHLKPMRVKIKIEKSDEYGDKNKIVSYKPRNATPPQQETKQLSPEMQAMNERFGGETPKPATAATPW